MTAGEIIAIMDCLDLNLKEYSKLFQKLELAIQELDKSGLNIVERRILETTKVVRPGNRLEAMLSLEHARTIICWLFKEKNVKDKSQVPLS